MAKTPIEDHFQWSKSLLNYLERVPWTINGSMISKDDCYRVAFSVSMWCSITLDIGRAHGLERQWSRANVSRWVRWLASTPNISELVERQKSVLSFVRDTASFPYLTFTALRKRWMSLMSPKEPLFFVTPLVYMWLRSRDASVFRSLNTWIQFTLRLTLHDTQSVEEANVDSYLAFEADLRSRTYPEDLIHQLRVSIHELFSGLSLGDSAPYFSSGATSEVPRKGGVARKVRSDIPFGARQFLQRHEIVTTDYLASGTASSGICKFQLVPKGIDKKRSISMEPSWENFCQHAIFDAFDRYFQQHPRCRVDLHRQSYNRCLALVGSRDRSFSTIDLTNASDSVTLKLVKAVFRGLPIYPDLIRTRSAFVDLDKYRPGLVIELEKFAPMGSAVCFPMECAIFSGICHLAEIRLGRHVNYRVYGDDIVVETAACDEVIYLLEQFGFQVNLEKSFLGARFTESCGIECVDGHDVSPIRIPRSFDPYTLLLHKFPSPSAYVGALDFINEFFETEYILSRRFLLKALLEKYPETYFTYDGEYGVKTRSLDLNFHLKSRGPMARRRATGPDYQRPEWRCYVPKSTTAIARDDIRYELCLEALSKTDRPVLNELTVIQPRLGKTTTSLAKRWYPGWCNQQLHEVLVVLRGVRGPR